MSKITMGRHSYGEIKCVGQGRIDIGNFVSIADDVTAIFVGHRTDWITTFPFSSRHKRDEWPGAEFISGHPVKYGPIQIFHDVYIGHGATLMGGIYIGCGAVVAAGAVVRKPVFPYTIVAGNPAVPVAARLDMDQTLAMFRIGWWNWTDEKIIENMDLLLSNRYAAFIQKHDPLLQRPD